MNEAHQMCGSDEWRQAMRDVILPWALGDTDLGDDVLEVGPGYGAYQPYGYGAGFGYSSPGFGMYIGR